MERGETSHRLREAVILNDLSMVKRLLKQQPTLLQNPDFEDKSNTSLHLAAKYGHDEVAEYLISFGHDKSCNPDAPEDFYSPHMSNLGVSVNTDQHCPLHLAAMHGQRDVVKVLCSHFPDTVNRKDHNGATPLHHASSAHVIPDPSYTTKSSSKATVRTQEDVSIIETLVARGADVNAKNNRGDICLHNATAWGNLKAVRALIQAGADPLCRNFEGWAPHDYSLTVQAEVYYRNLVAEWEKRKADEDIRLQNERRAKGPGGVRMVTQDESDDAASEASRSRASSARSHATSSRSQTTSESQSETGLGISVGNVDAWK